MNANVTHAAARSTPLRPKHFLLLALYFGLLHAPIIVPPILGIYFFEERSTERDIFILFFALIYFPVSCVLATRWAGIWK
jgi:hypothetical protein